MPLLLHTHPAQPFTEAELHRIVRAAVAAAYTITREAPPGLAPRPALVALSEADLERVVAVALGRVQHLLHYKVLLVGASRGDNPALVEILSDLHERLEAEDAAQHEATTRGDGTARAGNSLLLAASHNPERF
ncbi:MAG: hypothetical protein AAFY55_18655 [Bacteroidota bacterium]